MRGFKFIAALYLGFALPAFAADAPTPAPATTTAVPADKPATADNPEKVVCKREIPTGSTLPKRVCKTMLQIERERADAARLRDQTRANR